MFSHNQDCADPFVIMPGTTSQIGIQFWGLYLQKTEPFA